MKRKQAPEYSYIFGWQNYLIWFPDRKTIKHINPIFAARDTSWFVSTSIKSASCWNIPSVMLCQFQPKTCKKPHRSKQPSNGASHPLLLGSKHTMTISIYISYICMSYRPIHFWAKPKPSFLFMVFGGSKVCISSPGGNLETLDWLGERKARHLKRAITCRRWCEDETMTIGGSEIR